MSIRAEIKYLPVFVSLHCRITTVIVRKEQPKQNILQCCDFMVKSKSNKQLTWAFTMPSRDTMPGVSFVFFLVLSMVCFHTVDGLKCLNCNSCMHAESSSMSITCDAKQGLTHCFVSTWVAYEVLNSSPFRLFNSIANYE